MIDRDFLCNRNINEANSLPDLVQSINPDAENELNFIEHSYTIVIKSIRHACHVQMVSYGC